MTKSILTLLWNYFRPCPGAPRPLSENCWFRGWEHLNPGFIEFEIVTVSKFLSLGLHFLLADAGTLREPWGQWLAQCEPSVNGSNRWSTWHCSGENSSAELRKHQSQASNPSLCLQRLGLWPQCYIHTMLRCSEQRRIVMRLTLWPELRKVTLVGA